MSIIQINSIEGIPANASYDDLEFGHYTGQAILLSGSGRDKKYSYRHGVATNLGDIEEAVWFEAMLQLIERSGEQELFEQLLDWVTEHIPYLHTKKERHNEALILMSYRMFDEPKWVDYVEFNRKYRPSHNLKEVSAHGPNI